MPVDKNHVSCDGPGCNAVKGETNHWFSVEIVNTDGAVLVLAPFTGYQHMKHYCGAACTLKAVSAFIAKLGG